MTEEKETKEYVLVKVPTGEALAFQTPKGEVVSTEQLLVEIANKITNVEKAVA